MAKMGTRKFWRPSGTSGQTPAAILKNSGYINITLHSAYYHSRGNLWQRTFGGTNRIALTSTLTFQTSKLTLEAKAVQDTRVLNANRDHYLGLSRLVALKIPATADGLEMKVALSAIKDDNLGNGLQLLNSDEFKQPLQLLPIQIGQIMAVTNVVKKLFTGVENPNQLEATYAGILGSAQSANPVEDERLVPGYLIMISNQDDDSGLLQNVDPTKLSVVGDGLRYNGRAVELTYLIYLISFDALRGVDEGSIWFAKYQAALEKLDEIVVSPDDRQRTFDESKKLWIEGSALLGADGSYIASERNSIKATAFKAIEDRYAQLTGGTREAFIGEFLRDDMAELRFFEDDDGADPFGSIEVAAESYVTSLGEAGMVTRF